MKNKVTVLVCALALGALVVQSAAAVGGYVDVPDKAWYAPAVEEMTQKGYMNGVGEKMFKPDDPVTRATVVTALWRLEGKPVVENLDVFRDVGQDKWYSDSIAWAAETGIAAGDGNGVFRPDAPATRQELAVLLLHYAEYKQWDESRGRLDLYSDEKMISGWARVAMSYAVGMGFLEGNDGKLNPGGTATRAQLAVILQRLVTPAMG